MAKKGKFEMPEMEVNPVNVFGCFKCSILVIQYDHINVMNCPLCDATLDVFVNYKYVALSQELMENMTGTLKLKETGV